MPHALLPRERLGAVLVRAAALWILTGALYKLLWGSAADLPATVRDLASAAGLGLGLTLRLVIGIEVSIAGLALLRPLAVWWLVALQLTAFLAVLFPMILEGATSCGCFGSRVTIPPATMAGIDGALLAAILLTAPWRAARSRLSPALALPVLLLAWSAPWLVMGFSDPKLEPPSGGADGAAWQPPRELPRAVELNPDRWVGKSLSSTELASLVDVSAYPGDADWVLYSVTCDHCARYLRELWASFQEDPKLYVFVRLSQANEEKYRQVQPEHMPPGEEAVLPVTDYVIKPPWHLRVQGGIVVDALHPPS